MRVIVHYRAHDPHRPAPEEDRLIAWVASLDPWTHAALGEAVRLYLSVGDRRFLAVVEDELAAAGLPRAWADRLGFLLVADDREVYFRPAGEGEGHEEARGPP
jgi:hypothetical protein